jgi:SAM-dependent methyltransferase
MLPKGESLLDVGCGDGFLGRAIRTLRPDLTVRGLDVLVRDESRVGARPFDGVHIPEPDKSVDATLLVDVLHHADDPERLLAECVRVSRKSVIIKDHLCESEADRRLLKWMDDVGNERFHVSLPYGYLSEKQWLGLFERNRLTVAEWIREPKIHPPPVRWIIPARLHFLAKLSVPARVT